MQEYYSEAIVLDKEPIGEADVRVHLFTKEFGKIVARGRSVRKITSKLAAHLEPLSRIRVRLVEKSGIQVVDALEYGAFVYDPVQMRRAVAIMHLVKSASAEHHPDIQLWEALSKPRVDGRAVLSLLGFDAMHARCHQCQKLKPEYFHLRDHIYFCATHAAAYSKTDLYFRL